jgi:hypothetical protein
MANKASYYGVAAIMDAYDSVSDGSAKYSLWHNSRDIAFRYDGDDFEAGRQKLETFLELLAQNMHNATLILKIHPAHTKSVSNKTSVISTLYVCVQPLPDKKPDYVAPASMAGIYSPYPGQVLTQDQWRALDSTNTVKNLPDLIGSIIEAKFEALGLKNDDEDVEVEPVKEPDTIGSILAEHLKNPEIIKGVLGFLQRLMPGQSAPTPAINGVETVTTNPVTPPQNTKNMTESEIENLSEAELKPMVEKFDADLVRLSHHCNIYQAIGKLADYADKNPAMFKQILSTI